MKNQICKVLTQAGLPKDMESPREIFYSRSGRVEKGELTFQEKGELLGQIADVMPDILFLYDVAQQGCVYVNRQLSVALGFTYSEICGMGAALFDNLLAPGDLQPFADGIKKLRTSQDDGIYETEYCLRHANGEWRWFHFRVTVFTRDGGGFPELILYAARDMTDYKKYEESLRQAEVLAALRRVSARIEREINTPLANIKNSLFLLRSALLPDHPDTKYLQWSEEEVDRIAEAVRQLGLRV